MKKDKITKILISAGIMVSVMGVTPVMMASAQPLNNNGSYSVDSSNSNIQKAVVNTTVQLSNGTANKYDMAVITGENGNNYSIITQYGATGSIPKSDLTVVKSGIGSQLVKLNEIEHVIHVTTDLNVRQQPDVHSGLLTTLRDGANVQVVGQEGQWLKVNVNNQTGYVYNDFMQKGGEIQSNVSSSNTSSQETKNNTSNVTVTNNNTNSNSKQASNKPQEIVYNNPEYGYINIQGGYLNVRSGAGMGSSVVGKLVNNEAVTILAKEGNWYKVSIGNKVGWIDGNYITFVNSKGEEISPSKSASNKTEVGNKNVPVNKTETSNKNTSTSKAEPKKESNQNTNKSNILEQYNIAGTWKVTNQTANPIDTNGKNEVLTGKTIVIEPNVFKVNNVTIKNPTYSVQKMGNDVVFGNPGDAGHYLNDNQYITILQVNSQQSVNNCMIILGQGQIQVVNPTSYVFNAERV
ncbi:MAG: SH3 domain-containing protein [Clostridium sp.]|uniref:SH3 domain-containing protein n=1 Tax=Clostridium sp. TaxID=1506 RepID=UPI003EE5CBAD